MKAAFLVALVVAISLPLIPTVGVAQTAPGVPTSIRVSSGTTSLTITWTAPSETGSTTITAYDLQYMRSDGADSGWTEVEEIWNSGSLSYTLSGLRRDTAYDIQLRAVNNSGLTEGDWSAAEDGSTTDHSNSNSGATILSLGSSIAGSVTSTIDEDYFRIDIPPGYSLGQPADLWVYANGELDSYGELRTTGGHILAASDDSRLLDHPLGFSIRYQVATGRYYVRVTGSQFEASTGSYELHALTVDDPGDSFTSATTISVNSMTPGRIDVPRSMINDRDYYSFVLTQPAEIWAIAIGPVDTVGQLLTYSDPDETLLVENDDSAYVTNVTAFMFRQALEAGTYYIRVRGYNERSSGSYTLFLRTVDSPGSAASSAVSIKPWIPATGHISSASDADYFELTLDSQRYMIMYFTSFDPPQALDVVVLEGTNELDIYTNSHSDLAGLGDEEQSFYLWAKLEAGTYHIRVRAASGGTPIGYLLIPFVDLEYEELAELCTVDLAVSDRDPFYGCQWHLNNTGQFPDGAGRDIGVEDVWDTLDPLDPSDTLDTSTLGAGIYVAVVDDGFDTKHEDLSDNVFTVRNHDYGTRNDIYHPLETHGTAVAGIIAARDNDIGVRGVAPRSTIYGYNLIAQDPNAVGTGPTSYQTIDNAGDAMTRNMLVTAVSNNSWGFPDFGFPSAASATWESAVERGVSEGYVDTSGSEEIARGVSYVWAAGNGHLDDDNSNLDGRANHYAVIAVCSVNYADKRSSYSELGANLWVWGPSNDPTDSIELPGITTTRVGSRYRDDFGGTSAATPVVSGVVALIRAANTDLSWRDVKVILANSARKNDPTNSGWLAGANKLRFDYRPIQL